MLYKSYQVRYLTEIQQYILEVVKIENEMQSQKLQMKYPKNRMISKAQKFHRLSILKSGMDEKMEQLVKSYKNRSNSVAIKKDSSSSQSSCSCSNSLSLSQASIHTDKSASKKTQIFKSKGSKKSVLTPLNGEPVEKSKIKSVCGEDALDIEKQASDIEIQTIRK